MQKVLRPCLLQELQNFKREILPNVKHHPHSQYWAEELQTVIFAHNEYNYICVNKACSCFLLEGIFQVEHTSAASFFFVAVLYTVTLPSDDNLLCRGHGTGRAVFS